MHSVRTGGRGGGGSYDWDHSPNGVTYSIQKNFFHQQGFRPRGHTVFVLLVGFSFNGALLDVVCPTANPDWTLDTGIPQIEPSLPKNFENCTPLELYSRYHTGQG